MIYTYKDTKFTSKNKEIKFITLFCNNSRILNSYYLNSLLKNYKFTHQNLVKNIFVDCVSIILHIFI